MTLASLASASAQSFSLTVQPNTIPAVTQGQAYSQQLTAVGGNAPYSFAITAGALPAGVTMDSAGLISGTSNTSGSYSFTVTTTDATTPTGNTGFRSYTLSIGAAGGLTINPSSLPNGFVGTAYNQTVTASGGSGGYVYSISAGALPNGLSFNTGTGAITGTPTTIGPFSFTVSAIDSDSNTGSRAYTVNINNLTVNPVTLPNGAVSSAYSQNVTASGGTGSGQIFTLSAGALPSGLSLSSGGAITGTPSAAGPYTFTVHVVDSGGSTGSRAYTVNIGGNILAVTPAMQPGGTVGVGYSQNFGATGGTGSYTFARTSGALPTGLSLTAGGTLSGTPSTSGTFNFDVTATDTNFNTGTRSYSITINLAPLTITPASLPAGTTGTVYNATLTGNGGTAPYNFSVISGALPTGLTLGGGGGITGTPTVAGSYSFTAQVTDATPNTGTRAYTINIGSSILTVNPATLPNGTQGTAYNQTVTGSGGTGPYTFALLSGAFPAGVTMNGAGVISGTPAANGAFIFTIGATDSVGNTGSRLYNVNFGSTSLTVNPATVPAGTLGAPYSQTVTATGGTGGPYTFTLASGALPAGLTLSSAGVISGTPTAGGAASFTVRAVDALGNVGSRALTINIGTVTLTVNPATLPGSITGQPYSHTVTATGGTAPYTFVISAGALPPGLTLNAVTGVISGTPTSGGGATFTVQATDVNGNTGSRAYTFTSRPDPALDPDVQGLITAQVASAQRFAVAQNDNVSRHLETLHDQFKPCSVDFGAMPQLQAPVVSKDPWGPAYVTPPPGYGAPNYGAPNYGAPGRAPGSPDCALDWASSMAVWTAGSFQFGNMTPNGLTDANKFMSSGLTAGVDIRMTDKLIVGAALGFGADRTDVGSNGSRSDGTSFSGTLYASLRLFQPLFVDANVGYGLLNYNNNRWVTDDSTMVSGKRTGAYWFGGVTASLELGRDAVKFAPYARADFISATLGDYSEQGSSAELLSYNKMSFNATSGSVGLRGSIDIPTDFGMLTPNARLEYRQTMQSAYDQSLYYTDLGSGSASTLSTPAGTYGSTTGTLGVRLRASGGLSVELEYGLTRGTNSLQAQSLRAALRVPF